MVMKKGQMTLFIIIGVVVVILAILVYSLVLRPSTEKEVAEITSLEDERVALEDYVQTCSDDSLQTAMNSFGRRFALLDPNQTYSVYGPPLFYHDGKKDVPILATVEKEMETPLEEQVSYCVGNYVPVIADSLDLGRVSVTLEPEDKTSAVVSVDATLLFENKSISLEKDFTSIQNGSIKNYLAVADAFVSDYVDNGGALCTTCLVDANEKYGVTFSITPIGDEQLVVVKDENYLFEGVPYEFRFGVENFA